MTINPLTAANAYRDQLKLTQDAGSGEADDAGGATGGSAFATLLQNVAKGAVNAQYQSEAAQMQSMTGKVELTDLVTAVANAELSLNTIVAMRDRVINAYNDIIKMAI